MGYNMMGYNMMGYNMMGYNMMGYNMMGYNMMGYNMMGYNMMGYKYDGIQIRWNKSLHTVETDDGKLNIQKMIEPPGFLEKGESLLQKD